MIKQNFRIFVALFVVLLLPPALAGARSNSAANEAPPVVTKLVRSAQSWDGELLPAYPSGQPEVTILRISIPAGTKLEMHHHPVINAGVLISGQLTVVTEAGKTLQLQAGDPIVEVVNTRHYGINQGREPAEIIVFYAGVVDTPITIIEPQ